MKRRTMVTAALALLVCTVVWGATLNVRSRGNSWTVRGNTGGDFFAITDGAVTNSGTLAQSGAVTLTGDVAATGAMEVYTPTAVALTSPTATFSVAGASWFTLTSDANLTGVYPIGGTLNQVVYIEGGAGSNTIQFNDGAAMTIGSNYVITEGQGDMLTLKCTHADGDEWKMVCSGQN
jgi:hypothetical protein